MILCYINVLIAGKKHGRSGANDTASLHVHVNVVHSIHCMTMDNQNACAFVSNVSFTGESNLPKLFEGNIDILKYHKYYNVPLFIH